MTKDRKSYAFKINIARNVKNQSNGLDYDKYSKLETNVK